MLRELVPTDPSKSEGKKPSFNLQIGALNQVDIEPTLDPDTEHQISEIEDQFKQLEVNRIHSRRPNPMSLTKN